MAKVIVRRNQQEEMRRLHPKPAYSRLVTVGIAVGADAGMSAMVRTDPIASNFWILSIGVSLSSMDPTKVAWVRWQLFIGTGKGMAAAEVHKQWERLFPSVLSALHPDMRVCGSISTRYTLMKYFEGQPRSLAAYLYNWKADVGCDVEFVLEISEG